MRKHWKLKADYSLQDVIIKMKTYEQQQSKTKQSTVSEKEEDVSYNVSFSLWILEPPEEGHEKTEPAEDIMVEIVPNVMKGINPQV